MSQYIIPIFRKTKSDKSLKMSNGKEGKEKFRLQHASDQFLFFHFAPIISIKLILSCLK